MHNRDNDLKNQNAEENNKKSFVILVGPRTPPVTGLAMVSEWLIAKINRKNIDVCISDITVKPTKIRILYILKRIYSHLRSAIKLVQNATKPNKNLLIHVNGDFGIIFSAGISLVGRVLSYQLFLYHHSSRYVRGPSFLARMLMAISGKQAWHLLAADSMAQDMARRYENARHFLVIDNSAFVAPTAAQPRMLRQPPTLGFLSNLAVGKGVDTTLDLLRALHRRAPGPWRLVMAGRTLDAQTDALVKAAAVEFGSALDLRGPVWADQKDAFFQDIDILIFPTSYKHETQSLVVPEALSHAIPVLAYDHAYVGTLLASGGGRVFPPGEEFLHGAVEQIIAWSADPDSYGDASSRALAHFLAAHAEGQRQVLALEQRLGETRQAPVPEGENGKRG